MVPPPSAVMQPSMQTPAQSMLRRPAASAAVIAFDVSATYVSTCNTVSLGGRLHMATSHWEPENHRFQHYGVARLARNTPSRQSLSLHLHRGANGGTIHGIPTQSERSLPPRPER